MFQVACPHLPCPPCAYSCGAGAFSHADNAVYSLDDLELESLGHREPYPSRLSLPARRASIVAYRGAGTWDTPERARGFLERMVRACGGTRLPFTCAGSWALLRAHDPA